MISIPGSHDSASDSSTSLAYNLVPGPWKTQNLNIEEQLAIGVRFLDLRINCDQGQPITFSHGPVPVGNFDKFTTPAK